MGPAGGAVNPGFGADREGKFGVPDDGEAYGGHGSD